MELDFNCDRKAKNDFTASTYSYFTTHYPQYTAITYYEADKWGNLIPYGDPRAYEQAHIDTYIKLESSARTITYSVELKERWGRYISTYYGEEGQEGWVYNYEKDGWLMDEVEKGRIPLFCNEYPDDKMTIWNILKVDKSHNIRKAIKKVNIDPNSERKVQDRIQLWNKDGITIERIRT